VASSWEAALRFFVALANEEPLTVVLDEVPYLVASTTGFASIVQAKAWDPDRSTEANLLRLAGAAGGVLLEDAASMLAEELVHPGGYTRVLAAVGRGRTRFAEIASESGQRVERPLEILIRAGLIARALPVGAPRGARASYEIADPYLAFWFGVLYSEVANSPAGLPRSRAVAAQGCTRSAGDRVPDLRALGQGRCGGRHPLRRRPRLRSAGHAQPVGAGAGMCVSSEASGAVQPMTQVAAL
jgi:hypothetical protein